MKNTHHFSVKYKDNPQRHSSVFLLNEMEEETEGKTKEEVIVVMKAKGISKWGGEKIAYNPHYEVQIAKTDRWHPYKKSLHK